MTTADLARIYRDKAKAAGMAAARKGQDIESCPYRSLAMIDSWLASYREFMKRMEQCKK